MILAACTSSGAKQGGDLTGKVWALTELKGKPPVAGTGISAEFTADGKVAGSAGCNRYSGTYTVSGSNITFSTQMAADDDDVRAGGDGSGERLYEGAG